jgi:hypothetical protein
MKQGQSEYVPQLPHLIEYYFGKEEAAICIQQQEMDTLTSTPADEVLVHEWVDEDDD